MNPNPEATLPPKQARALKRATKLEYLTILYLISSSLVLFIVMGASQAMMTAWIEDMLSLIPPSVFLIAERLRRKPPTEQYPYGFHRVFSIAFLIASLSLLAMDRDPHRGGGVHGLACPRVCRHASPGYRRHPPHALQKLRQRGLSLRA